MFTINYISRNFACLVVERFVVQTKAACDVIEGLGLLDVLDVESVADVHVEVVEVGVQFVHLDVLNGDTGVVEVVVFVGGLSVGVLPEDAGDVLVEVVEGGVPKGGLVVSQDAGDNLRTMNATKKYIRGAIRGTLPLVSRRQQSNLLHLHDVR